MLLLSTVYERFGRLIGTSEVDVTATPKGVTWHHDDAGGGAAARVEQVVDFVITSESDEDAGAGWEGLMGRLRPLGTGGPRMQTRTLKDVRLPLVGSGK